MTNNNDPLISVYMPTRNRAGQVSKAILSVLNQSWLNFEFIIVNDASTDNTADVLHQWAQQDARIKVLHNATPLKACASRNKAIQTARGEFVTGIDDDDEFMPTRLSELYDAYNDNYSFVCSGYTWHTGTHKRKKFCSNAVISLATHLNHQQVSNQVLVKRKRLLAVGGFDEGFVSLQDYDCFTRLIKRYGPAYRIGKPLINIYGLASATRISTSDNFWYGYQQFIEKHGSAMSPKQLKNMQLRLAIKKNEPISLYDILLTAGTGLMPRKIKYYTQHKFSQYFNK